MAPFACFVPAARSSALVHQEVLQPLPLRVLLLLLLQLPPRSRARAHDSNHRPHRKHFNAPLALTGPTHHHAYVALAEVHNDVQRQC